MLLIKCLLNNTQNKNFIIDSKKLVCSKGSEKNISEELLKRFYLPLYLPLITIIGCLVILKAKEEKSYRNHKIFTFILGFSVIFISEASIKYTNGNLIESLIFFLVPLSLSSILYLYIKRKLNHKIEDIND